MSTIPSTRDVLLHPIYISHPYFFVVELNPSELAPLDAFGNPKYKGRKRGRKPKKRKRALNPNRQKRQHTAYTLFVHEVYPTIRAQYQDTENYQSKDIIGLVARQWATISEEEKRLWKERALASHQDTVDVEEEDGDNEDDEEDEEDDDELQQEEEVEVEVPKPKRGRSKKKV